jgi:hypothetical protein
MPKMLTNDESFYQSNYSAVKAYDQMTAMLEYESDFFSLMASASLSVTPRLSCHRKNWAVLIPPRPPTLQSARHSLFCSQQRQTYHLTL